MKESTYFWHDTLTKGAVLGGVMLVSSIFEQSLMVYRGTAGALGLMGFEMLLAFVLYVWLLWRFAKSYSLGIMSGQEEPKMFAFSQGFSYVLTVVLLAGVIVQLGQYVFVHWVVGYDTYVERYVAVLEGAVSSVSMPANVADMYEALFHQMREQSEPSLFSTLASNLWNYLLGGVLLGLIIGAAVKRNPRVDE